jgi:dynein intermediate chain 1
LFLFLQPTREVVKPDNQLQLTEKQLNEEIAKMLTANNPSAPTNIARYDQKLRTYKFEPMVDMNMVSERRVP